MLLCVASCRPEARTEPPPPIAAPAPAPARSVPDVKTDGDWPWPGPYCFAYSKRLASYACTHLYANPTADSEQDLASESMFDTMTFVRGTRANVHLGVDLVSAFGAREVAVYRSHPFLSTTTVTVPEARALLLESGFVDPVPHQVVLEPDAWVSLRDIHLRYHIDVHEGDASYEIRGTLELRCTPDGPAHPVDLDPRDGIGGPFAVASAADGTGLYAITVEHQDGGEGYTDVVWRSYILDAERWC